MEQYMEILKSAIPGITSEDLDTPISESSIHSLDTVIVRDALETKLGYEIPNEDWYRFRTLNDTLRFLRNKNNALDNFTGYEKASILYRDQEINLPQMANCALSENWLLREMGDMHWALLSRGLEQKTSEFADSEGNRLYAAFVRINYSLNPLNEFKENELLHLKGAVKRLGNHTYFSTVKGLCNANSLQATLMTSFSAKKSDDNTQFSNGKPSKNDINHIDELNATPEFYNEHRQLKKGKVQVLGSGGHTFKITDSVVYSNMHKINPHYDVNGVGLLYFAAYPVIADECTTEFMETALGISGYNQQYHTSHRDIFYIANCNVNDKIRIDLNTIEHIEGNIIKYSSSLVRMSDNKLMARILTVKQKK